MGDSLKTKTPAVAGSKAWTVAAARTTGKGEYMLSDLQVSRPPGRSGHDLAPRIADRACCPRGRLRSMS